MKKSAYTTQQIDQWILDRLPQDLPDEVLEKGLSRAFFCFSFRGLQVYEMCDYGKEICCFQADSEEDLLKWSFCQAADGIAAEHERLHREDNSAKWRFSRADVQDGHWRYIERKNYRYHAIEDTRLSQFEMFLRLTKPVLPFKEWMKKVEEYLLCMNLWYQTKHWDYDCEKMCFIEVSDSKEHDTNGIEEPGEGSILRVIE